MIKTETRRRVIYSTKELPPDVRTAVDEWNRVKSIKIDILFNDDDNRWEIYRVKGEGANSMDDLLHWQMSAPTIGTLISPGILDWLKKYDTSQGGYLDQDDLRKEWLRQVKEQKYEEKQKKEKFKEHYSANWEDIIKKIATQREQIVVPRKVKYANGKTTYAVPKGTVKKLETQLEKVKHGS